MQNSVHFRESFEGFHCGLEKCSYNYYKGHSDSLQNLNSTRYDPIPSPDCSYLYIYTIPLLFQ